MKRPRLALRIREKSAAATPVRAWAARTVSFSRSSIFDNFSSENRLQLLNVGVCIAEVAKNVTAAVHELDFSAFHPRTSFRFFSRFLIRSISCGEVLMPCVDFFGRHGESRFPPMSAETLKPALSDWLRFLSTEGQG